MTGMNLTNKQQTKKHCSIVKWMFNL